MSPRCLCELSEKVKELAPSRARTTRFGRLAAWGCGVTLLVACDRKAAPVMPRASSDAIPTTAVALSGLPSSSAAIASSSATPSASAPSAAPGQASRVDYQDTAMGTSVHFIAYSNESASEDAVKAAMQRALAEMRRLEAMLSEWHDDSEVGMINLKTGEWVTVSPETFEVISRAQQESVASHGTFDITFQAMSGLWKFGSAADEHPSVPPKAEIEKRRKLIDYRKVELDPQKHAVRLAKDHKIGLGGIAKGYIVDRAADVLKRAGVRDFLVQAGGDLFGAGRKPDGSPWVSGIQDPRGEQGKFFATIELTNHAFSTAGDYARAYVIDGKRYHHIIDPRTGYPATASRSVTVWAEDATTADAIDDAVFILGPKEGLKLVEATPGVGVVIVDKDNRVWVSERLAGKVHIEGKPTDGI
jgi:thiamine biosynthesis lipoprotein